MEKNLRTSFKKKIEFNPEFNRIKKLLKQYRINTICQSAICPNISECFSRKKLTFLIMGQTCTRNCRFCNVKTGSPDVIDLDEVQRIKEIIRVLQLRYIIITSVTRDDIPDGGAEYFRYVVQEIKKEFPIIKVEILIPDFGGKTEYLRKVAFSGADVVGHNIETIERLYPEIRPMADFKVSLSVLNKLKELNPSLITKSGFMVGLGETSDEVKELLRLLYESNVDSVTIGQYFQPSKNNLPVKKYVTDNEFKLYENWAKQLGFKYVLSGRYVRSSSLEIT